MYIERKNRIKLIGRESNQEILNSVRENRTLLDTITNMEWGLRGYISRTN